MDKGYEKILKIIKSIIKNNQKPSIEIGTYIDGGIQMKDITVPKSMVYRLDFLDKKRAIKVDAETGVGGAGYEAHTHEFKNKTEYIDELKNGDLIAYQQINSSKFLIIGRVIE